MAWAVYVGGARLSAIRPLASPVHFVVVLLFVFLFFVFVGF